MSEWQPIETAPKDGKAVLLYSRKKIARPYPIYDGAPGMAAHVCVGWHGSPNMYYPSSTSVWLSTDVESEIVTYGEMTGSSIESEQVEVFPTHWMPLPPPPYQKENET